MSNLEVLIRKEYNKLQPHNLVTEVSLDTFPIGSNNFNVGYDSKGLGRKVKPKVLDKDVAVHNSDYGGGNAAHRSRGGHKGIDIFSPKGTAVVAPVSGVVKIVGTPSTNKLGGNSVTIKKGNLNYYHAHLDKTTVKAGDKVSAGEKIGTVGNTGNARNTHPHLHFGIYGKGGHNNDSKDPWPALKSVIGNVTIVDRPGQDLASDDETDANLADTERNYGDPAILNVEAAWKVYGNGWKSQKAFEALWKAGAVPAEIIKKIYWLKIPTTYGDLLSFQQDDEVYSYQIQVTIDYTTTPPNIQEQGVLNPIVPTQAMSSIITKTGSEFSKERKRLQQVKKNKPGESLGIFLKQESPAGDSYIEVFDVPNRPGYISIPELEAMQTAEAPASFIDRLQTIADWVGLVPGIGDVVDFFNAIVYFWRGKNLEGILTTVAIIPAVGSIISLSIKRTLQSLKKLGPVLSKIGKPATGFKTIGATEKAWTQVLLRALKPKQLKILAKWLPKLVKGASWIKRKLQGLPAGSKIKKVLLNGIKKFGNAIGTLGRSTKSAIRASKIAKAANKAITSEPSQAMLNWTKKFIRGEKAHVAMNAGKIINKRLKKLFGWNFKPYQKNMARAIQKSFFRKIIKSPYWFTRMALKNKKITLEFQGSIVRILENSKLSGPQVAAAIKKLSGTTPVHPNKMKDILDDVIKLDPSVGKNIYKTMEETTKAAVRANPASFQKSMFKYQDKVLGNWGELRSILDPQTMSNLGRKKEHILTHMPLVWNEIEDVLEEAGVFKVGQVDNPQSVLMAGFIFPLYSGLTEYLNIPYVSKPLKTVGSAIKTGLTWSDKVVQGFFGNSLSQAAYSSLGLKKQKAFFRHAWENSYPGMTDKEKVAHIFRSCGGNAKCATEIHTNLGNAITAGATKDVTTITHGDLNDVWADYTAKDRTNRISEPEPEPEPKP